ncbi:hypothetical protein N7476_009728 [Penicillium atrosanguineum]|uniref:Amino acid permease/ SLC12A domain-containing protein n=1 Tax=Penicillium atrosanguineum TaxID=1132637 RepID=A0A9W9PQT7_9EURO|nr:hypothetical protein N7476_009728 [Penicillium atrosanguineum]
MPDCDAEKQPPLNATFRAFSDNPVCAGIKNVNALLLARKLFPHQIQMIAIGGTVGTGLYLGNGKALATGGPASMLLAYTICGGHFLCGNVRFWRDGGFYSSDRLTRYICREVTGLQVLLESWTEHFPGWALGLICLAFLLGLNLCSVKVYGEVFVIVGIIVNCGATTPLIHILERHISTCVTITLSVGSGALLLSLSQHLLHSKTMISNTTNNRGTENVAVASGETRGPVWPYPRVIRNVFWRIPLFYVVSITIIGLDVSFNHSGIYSEIYSISPLKIVFVEAGSAIAGSFFNARRRPSSLGLIFSTPWQEKDTLHRFSLHNSSARSALERTKLVLVSFEVGVSNHVSWVCICIIYIRFHAAARHYNLEHMLPFKLFKFPVGPALAVGLKIFLVLIQGWSCFSSTSDAISFLSHYIEIQIILAIFLGWKFY